MIEKTNALVQVNNKSFMSKRNVLPDARPTIAVANNTAHMMKY